MHHGLLKMGRRWPVGCSAKETGLFHPKSNPPLTGIRAPLHSSCENCWAPPREREGTFPDLSRLARPLCSKKPTERADISTMTLGFRLQKTRGEKSSATAAAHAPTRSASLSRSALASPPFPSDFGGREGGREGGRDKLSHHSCNGKRGTFLDGSPSPQGLTLPTRPILIHLGRCHRLTTLHPPDLI